MEASGNHGGEKLLGVIKEKVGILVVSILLVSIIMTGAVIIVLDNSQEPTTTFVSGSISSDGGNVIDEKVLRLKEALQDTKYSVKGSGSTETNTYVSADSQGDDHSGNDTEEVSRLKKLLLENHKNF